jgi:hypothetical protein
MQPSPGGPHTGDMRTMVDDIQINYPETIHEIRQERPHQVPRFIPGHVEDMLSNMQRAREQMAQGVPQGLPPRMNMQGGPMGQGVPQVPRGIPPRVPGPQGALGARTVGNLWLNAAAGVRRVGRFR